MHVKASCELSKFITSIVLVDLAETQKLAEA